MDFGIFEPQLGDLLNLNLATLVDFCKKCIAVRSISSSVLKILTVAIAVLVFYHLVSAL